MGYGGRFVEPQRTQRTQRVSKAGAFTFDIASKVTKGLGPKPPKAEKPGGIPKIRKLATLRQYGFLNEIPPGFSPAERFFRQRPRGYEGYWTQTVQPPVMGLVFDTPCFIRPPQLSKTYTFLLLTKS